MKIPKVNTTLSVTVLTACLCLLAAGAPTGARTVSAGTAAPSVARAFVKLRAAAVEARDLKLMGRSLATAAAPVARTQDHFYKNATPAPIENVLVVTSLARAAIPGRAGETA